MLSQKEIAELTRFSAQIRWGAMRAIKAAGWGHVGGSFSMADLISVLFGHSMKVDPQNPKWEERDWLVTSKGHSGPAVYAALALKGFFPIDWLDTMNQPGTRLPSHTDRILTPGVDMTTGSLGQGLSLAVGAALGMKLDGKKNRMFCIIGDGESQEGQIWEAVLYAAQQKLGNLICIVDDNGMQIDGVTADVNNMEDYVAKFKAFNWDAVAVDGHDYQQLVDAIENAAKTPDQPTAIVMHTIKGKGFQPAIDIGYKCHSMHMDEESFDKAIADLYAAIPEA